MIAAYFADNNNFILSHPALRFRRYFMSCHQLTTQEQSVLALVARGQRTAKIADELGISPRTVECHLYRIYDKLGVSSRTQAALYVLKDSYWDSNLSGNTDAYRADGAYHRLNRVGL